MITGRRASHGPYRPHTFHVAMRTRVRTSGPYPGSYVEASVAVIAGAL
jgi:hypothetical protein